MRLSRGCLLYWRSTEGRSGRGRSNASAQTAWSMHTSTCTPNSLPRATPPRERADMPAPPDDLRGRSLLAVFAHPDDESLACGGLIARCADLGAQVSLLCVTHCEHGQGTRLGEVRAQELREASRVLGIANLVLLHYQDGMLPWVDAEHLEADIHAAIRRFNPHVVVTFDEDGLYWHPDHIAVHERTTAAVAAMGANGPALYYVTMPRGCARGGVPQPRGTLARSV